MSSLNYSIGDYITVHDEALGIDVKVRVVELNYHPYEPHHSTVVLGNPPRDVFEILSDISGIREFYYPKRFTPEETNLILEEIENVISGDEIFNMIEEITINSVLVAENAMILNLWAKNIWVDRLETNFKALDMREPQAVSRNYIRIINQTIEFITVELSLEGENYIIDGRQVFYSAIDEHPQAYLFFTLTPPEAVYPDKEALEDPLFVEELRERFAVKVRGQGAEQVKMKMGFDSNNKDSIPSIYMGIGDNYGHGKARITKESDGLYVMYSARGQSAITAGQEIGVRWTDGGVEYLDYTDGEWKLLGTGGFGGGIVPDDGHRVKDFMLLPREPVRADLVGLLSPTVIKVYDPDTSFYPEN